MPHQDRPLLPRPAAMIGAVLSALSVVYATSLLGALVGATIFFAFYRLLGPAPGAEASRPAPTAPLSNTSSARGRRAA